MKSHACSPSKTKRYRAVRKPSCSGGAGCWPCWAKYMLTHPNYGEIR